MASQSIFAIDLCFNLDTGSRSGTKKAASTSLPVILRITKHLYKALAGVFLVAMALWLAWQHRTIQHLRNTNAELREMAAQGAALGEENARLRQSQEEARKRTGDHTAEVARLRGEVSGLRQQLAASSAQLLKTRQEKRDPGQGNKNEEMVLETYVANTRTLLAPGQTAVTGGWSTQPGKRLLIFVQPEIIGAGPPTQILLQAKLIEMPEGVITDIGMDALRAEQKESSSLGMLNKEQAESILKQLEETAGVELLSAPRVATFDGKQARVQMSQTKMIGGSNQQVGPVIEFIPRMSADGSAVDLTISAQLRMAVPAR